MLIASVLSLGNLHAQEDEVRDYVGDTITNHTVFSRVQPDAPVVVLDQEVLDDYRDDPAFDYETRDEETFSLWDQFTDWLYRVLEWIFEQINFTPGPGFFNFMSVLPYVLIALGLGLMVYLFYRLSPNLRKPAHKPLGAVTLTGDAAAIEQLDLDKLLQESIDAGNTRAAVRYTYLIALRSLSQRERIRLENDKTNREYQKELGNTPEREPFDQIVRIYNYVWYGGFDVPDGSYDAMRRSYERLATPRS